MTVLNLRWLAGFTAFYLFLLPTNHGTYLRSIAFGGSLLFAAFALGWSLRERRQRPDVRIPLPPWSITIAAVAWFAWSALSYFWSVKPHYTAGQLAREVGENALLICAFFMASHDVVTFRRFAATALLSFMIMATLAIGYALTAGGWDPALKHNGVGPYSTYVVLTAPLLLTLIAPTPVGLKRRGLALALGAVLLAVLVASARLTDNRMVWIALAAVFATAAIASAVRWPRTVHAFALALDGARRGTAHHPGLCVCRCCQRTRDRRLSAEHIGQGDDQGRPANPAVAPVVRAYRRPGVAGLWFRPAHPGGRDRQRNGRHRS